MQGDSLIWDIVFYVKVWPWGFQWKALHVSTAFPSWWNSDPKFCLPFPAILWSFSSLPAVAYLGNKFFMEGFEWTLYTNSRGPSVSFQKFPPQCHHCGSPRVQLLIQWRLAIEFSDSACVQTDRCTSGNPQKKSQINAVLMQYSSRHSVFCFPLVPAFFFNASKYLFFIFCPFLSLFSHTSYSATNGV